MKQCKDCRFFRDSLIFFEIKDKGVCVQSARVLTVRANDEACRFFEQEEPGEKGE